VGAHLAHLGGRAGERQQVVLEDLDAREAGGGDRLELLVERAAQADRRDRRLHEVSPGWISACRRTTVGPCWQERQAWTRPDSMARSRSSPARRAASASASPS